MNSFVIHISDARAIDVQAAIAVENRMDLGRATQLALDELVEKYGASLTFPIFVDIHPAAEFSDRAWMHDATPAQRLEAPQRACSEVLHSRDPMTAAVDGEARATGIDLIDESNSIEVTPR